MRLISLMAGLFLVSFSLFSAARAAGPVYESPLSPEEKALYMGVYSDLSPLLEEQSSLPINFYAAYVKDDNNPEKFNALLSIPINLSSEEDSELFGPPRFAVAGESTFDQNSFFSEDDKELIYNYYVSFSRTYFLTQLALESRINDLTSKISIHEYLPELQEGSKLSYLIITDAEVGSTDTLDSSASVTLDSSVSMKVEWTKAGKIYDTVWLEHILSAAALTSMSSDTDFPDLVYSPDYQFSAAYANDAVWLKNTLSVKASLNAILDSSQDSSLNLYPRNTFEISYFTESVFLKGIIYHSYPTISYNLNDLSEMENSVQLEPFKNLDYRLLGQIIFDNDPLSLSASVSFSKNDDPDGTWLPTLNSITVSGDYKFSL